MGKSKRSGPDQENILAQYNTKNRLITSAGGLFFQNSSGVYHGFSLSPSFPNIRKMMPVSCIFRNPAPATMNIQDSLKLITSKDTTT